MKKCYRITEMKQLEKVWEIVKDNVDKYKYLYDCFTLGVPYHKRIAAYECYGMCLRNDGCVYITEEGGLLTEDNYRVRRGQFTVIDLSGRYSL